MAGGHRPTGPSCLTATERRRTIHAPMAVISVPRELRERLGDSASDSLVDMLRQVGAEQREDVITMVEERFALRLAETRDELRSEMHAGFLNLQEQIGGVRADLQEQIGGVRADLQEQIGGVRADLQEQIGSVRAEIGGVRAELHKEIGHVQEKIGEVHQKIAGQTRWLVTAILAATVLIPVMQKVLAALFP